MSKLTKNQKLVADKIEAGKAYTLKEAAELVKEITYTKFEASLDIDVRLGVDPRKANQMVRGVVTLPNGTGKVTRVLCLCTPDAEAAAKEAGADYVGLDEYIEKIKGGWTDIDVIITMPSCMGKVGPLGRVLGPRGLMPNPKSGTVTMDVVAAGNPKKIEQSKKSITGQYLSGQKKIETPKERRPKNKGKIVLSGAQQHNLQNVRLEVPLSTFTVITGVSGSGKSSCRTTSIPRRALKNSRKAK